VCWRNPGEPKEARCGRPIVPTNMGIVDAGGPESGPNLGLAWHRVRGLAGEKARRLAAEYRALAEADATWGRARCLRTCDGADDHHFAWMAAPATPPVTGSYFAAGSFRFNLPHEAGERTGDPARAGCIQLWRRFSHAVFV